MGIPSNELSEFAAVTLPLLLSQARKLFLPGELEQVSVRVDAGGELWLELVAVGEKMRMLVVSSQFAESKDELNGRFRSDLQDWIAESRFGWGQLRN